MRQARRFRRPSSAAEIAMRLFPAVLAIAAALCAGCQADAKDLPLPSFGIDLSHPDNPYLVTPVEGHVVLLDGRQVALPYGSSSGTWGQSGKGAGEDRGIPVGAQIVYYARYDDTFYRLDAAFPRALMETLAYRAYPNNESDSSEQPLQPYIDVRQVRDYARQFNRFGMSYYPMRGLVFGFAPEGLVAVWVRYGAQQVQVGTFRAQPVEDDARYADALFSTISVTRAQMRAQVMPDASARPWLDYQQRYDWAPVFEPPSSDAELYQVITEYFNGEREIMLRPWVGQGIAQSRAVPREMTLYWRSPSGNTLETAVRFDWAALNRLFAAQPGARALRFVDDGHGGLDVRLGDVAVPTLHLDSARSGFTFKP